MARIQIFFGEMGSGKSYNAKLQSQWEIVDFLEGDDLVPPEMVELVLQFKPLTRDMVVRLVDLLIKRINECAETRADLVVSQALYFDTDRRRIEAELNGAGHDVVWYWVRPSFFRNMKQLLSRPKGIRWVMYWLMNKPFFERPTHRHTEV